MCYAKPGPRCSRHAESTLRTKIGIAKRATKEHSEAEKAVEEEKRNDTSGAYNLYSTEKDEALLKATQKMLTTKMELRKAREEYYATPAGFKKLEKAIENAEENGHIYEANKLREELKHGKNRRENQLHAYRQQKHKNTRLTDEELDALRAKLMGDDKGGVRETSRTLPPPSKTYIKRAAAATRRAEREAAKLPNNDKAVFNGVTWQMPTAHVYSHLPAYDPECYEITYTQGVIGQCVCPEDDYCRCSKVTNVKMNDLNGNAVLALMLTRNNQTQTGRGNRGYFRNQQNQLPKSLIAIGEKHGLNNPSNYHVKVDQSWYGEEVTDVEFLNQDALHHDLQKWFNEHR